MLLLLLLLHACAVFVSATGRTPIKINSDRPAASWAWNGGGTGGDAGAGSGTRASPVGGRHAVPPLFRQPRAVVPPPFLQAAIALDSDAASAASDDTVFASYYGEPEVNTNTDAYITGGSGGADSNAEGSATGSDPLALANDESNAPTGHLDEFGYPVASSSSSSSEGSPWGAEAAAWTQLAGSCWTYTTTAYEYSFCPYHNVTQKSLSSTLHVIMGVWDEWIETGEAPVVAGVSSAATTTSSSAEAADTGGTAATAAVGSLPVGSIMQSFTDGTACGSGKRRSTRVLFLCESTSARESRISDVQEPATCEYTVKFHTPLVCPPGTAVQQEAAPEHAAVSAMQSCINALFVAQQRGAGVSEARAAVVERCRDYLSADDLASLSASPATAATDDLSSLVLEGDEAAAVRANIPSSILVDEDAAHAPSYTNAVVQEQPLNGGFAAEASSSPYAALDDREL